MTRTDTASLYDAAITQAERLVGLCDAEAVSLPEAIVGFERLVDLLQALGLRLPHGKQMTQLVRESRRAFVGSDRKGTRYDLSRRVAKPLTAARDEDASALPNWRPSWNDAVGRTPLQMVQDGESAGPRPGVAIGTFVEVNHRKRDAVTAAQPRAARELLGLMRDVQNDEHRVLSLDAEARPRRRRGRPRGPAPPGRPRRTRLSRPAAASRPAYALVPP